jgi:SAM-dependent methyltransferase
MTPKEKRATARAGYGRLLGHEPGWRTSRRIDRAMSRPGASVGSFLLELGRSERYRQAVTRRIGERPELTDDAFVAAAYHDLLHRAPDAAGSGFYSDQLTRGKSRIRVLEDLASSDEHVNRVVNEAYPLPDIRSSNPSRYCDVAELDGSSRIPCFVAESQADFDWMSEQIALHGYYDRPGIWGYTVTREKRVVAEMLSCFEPRSVLDLGCANGVVMRCLYDLGIQADGVELSDSAVQAAFPEIRDNIHQGDVIELAGDRTYDLILGLDIFEHVTPPDLQKLIAAIADLTEPGGFLFANIPAFGEDEVFGTVFEPYLEPWNGSAARGEPFDLLHVDDAGFPMHGHLIWAGSGWWETQFREHGFTRVPTVERALHERYDSFLREAAPARLAFYVFMKGDDAARTAAVVERIERLSTPLPA